MRLRHIFPLATTFIVLCLVLVSPGLSVLWAPSGQFNATSPITINWTTNVGNVFNGTILLGNSLTGNIYLDILNATSNIKNSTGSAANFFVYAWNGTGYDNTNQTNVSAGQIIGTTLLFDTTGLAPGRYNGTVAITNSTNSSDNVGVVVKLDVPIAINTTTGIGIFSGNVINTTNPINNATEIWYFNASSIGNVSGLRLNLTTSTPAANFVNFNIYDNNSTARGSAVLNNTTNSAELKLPTLFPLAGYWYVTAISNDTLDAIPISFSSSIELLQASLRVNATGYLNGTFDNNILDNLQNVTINDNIGLNYSRTAATFIINNSAGYDLNVTNITLESPRSKIIANGSWAILTNSSGTGWYNVSLVGIDANSRNATLNITNSTGNVTPYTVTEGTSFTTNEGDTGWVTYVQTSPGAAAVVFGAPVTNSSNLMNGSYSINYTINATNLTVNTNTQNTANITITLNTSTNNVSGIYSGWALIHTTNGYPYRAFKLALFVNLTNQLKINVTNVTDQTTGASWSVPGNTTNITVVPMYQNDSFVPGLNVSNFTVWITHQNASYLSASLANANITNFNLTNTTSSYNIVNATIPSTLLGGLYDVNVYVQDKTTSDKNSGTGTRTLNVSQTALKLAVSCVPTIMAVPANPICTIAVINYGSVPAENVNVSFSPASPSCLSLLNMTGFENTSTIKLGTLAPVNGNSTKMWIFNASVGTCAITVSGTASNVSGNASKWDTQSFSISFNVTAASTTTANSMNSQQYNTTNTSKALQVTSYPSETTLHQGEKVTATIKIKNVGAVSLADVKLNVTGVDSSWMNITPSTNTLLNKNNEGTWTVKFTAPDEATIGNYTISYTAWAAGASDSRIAKLVMQPGIESRSTINETLNNYTERYNNLSALINQSNTSGLNVTIAASKLAEAKDLLDRANAAKAEEDWAGVDALLGQIDGALTDAQTALDASKAGPIWNFNINVPWEWVGGIGAAAVVIVAVFYMLRLRKPGYYPELGYRATSSGGSSAGDKMRRLVERLKNIFRRKSTTSYPGV